MADFSGCLADLGGDPSTLAALPDAVSGTEHFRQSWWWVSFPPPWGCQAVAPGFSSKVAHVPHAAIAEHARINSI